jgi:hypothetical protein
MVRVRVLKKIQFRWSHIRGGDSERGLCRSVRLQLDAEVFPHGSAGRACVLDVASRRFGDGCSRAEAP